MPLIWASLQAYTGQTTWLNRREFTNEGFEPSLAMSRRLNRQWSGESPRVHKLSFEPSLAMSQRLGIGESSGAKVLTFAGDVSAIESAMVDKLGVNRREFTNEGFEPSLAMSRRLRLNRRELRSEGSNLRWQSLGDWESARAQERRFYHSLAMSRRLGIGESSGAKALSFAGDVSAIRNRRKSRKKVSFSATVLTNTF